MKCGQSHVFSSFYPTVPLLIALVHLYAVHHRLRQPSLGPLDCLVFAGLVKYIAMPAVFLMFMQRQRQTKQRNPCTPHAELVVTAFLYQPPHVATRMLIFTYFKRPLRVEVLVSTLHLHQSSDTRPYIINVV